MKIKATILASILAAIFPVAVKAQDITSYDEYKVSCEIDRECSDFDVTFQQHELNFEVTQRTRTRRTREKNRRKKIYLGGTLGSTFLGELENLETAEDFEFIDGERVPTNIGAVDLGSGYIGSLFAGFNFTDSLGGDLELFLLAGGADSIEGSYYLGLGLFANPRYTFLLDSDNSQSPYIYLSPGIGIVYTFLSAEFENEVFVDVERDVIGGVEGEGLGLQLKAGIGLPLSETFHLFGQARYFNGFNIFEVEDLNQNSKNQGFSSFSLEAGISLNFGG